MNIEQRPMSTTQSSEFPPQSSVLSTQSSKNETTPLELLNLHLTDGKSKGNKSNKLYQKFNRELSWDAILNKGYQTDLAPLLYHIINKSPELATCNLIISQETKSKLRALYNHYLATILIQFNELDKILSTFEREGIDVIQLKGAELAKNYYPNQKLRPMGDIDLLVRKEDIKSAKECLINQGYEFNENSKKNFPSVKHNTIALTIIDLHRYVAKSDFIKNNLLEFWENTLPINKNQRHILTIPEEFLLLHILWHTYRNLSNHLYLRLIWLLDIALIIREKDNIDWIFIEKKANEWGIQKQVYFCLYFTTQLFSIVFDKNIMRALMPSNQSIKIFDFVTLRIENKKQASKNSKRVYIILLNLISLNAIYERVKYLLYISKSLLEESTGKNKICQYK